MDIQWRNDFKILKSPGYNYLFNYKTGFFARCGKTKDEDPEYSPYGCEIADLEVSTICHKNCKFCYKSNTNGGINMSFDTFKMVFDKLPKTLTQIAFGIGDIDGNAELWKMMEYCRENKVVPNITINGTRMTEEYYDLLAKYCGAVAVSYYNDDECFNAVKQLTDRGMKQVNIHALLSEETIDDCLYLLSCKKTDSRLEKLNSIVFLWLKPKGCRNTYTQVKNYTDYEKLIDYALDNNVSIGFDSCSAPFFTEYVNKHPEHRVLEKYIEGCESGLFSIYIDASGFVYPCSFCEGEQKIGRGIDMGLVNSFVDDVWNSGLITEFRDKILKNKDCNGCRRCVAFDLGYNKV